MKIVDEIFKEARIRNISVNQLTNKTKIDRKTIWYLRYVAKHNNIRTILTLGKVLNMELVWRKKDEN